MKLRKYYEIFVYILSGKMDKTKKKGKKITQLKWPKYQKPKDKYMGWTKHALRNIWQLPIANNVIYECPQRIAARRPSSSLKWPRNGDGGKWKCDLSRGLYAFLQSHQTKGSKSDPALSSYLRWSLKLQHPLILPIPPLCFISQILNCITCSI